MSENYYEIKKSYLIPVEAPKDFLDDYLELKKKIFFELVKRIRREGNKIKLKFSQEDRKVLRQKLVREWKYSKHYVQTAIHMVQSLLKGWIKLYNKEQAYKLPKITRRTVYVKNTLFSIKDNKLKISISPGRYVEVDLSKYKYIPKDYNNINALLLTEKGVYLIYRYKIKSREPHRFASLDINLTNITMLLDEKVVRFDTRLLYHIHRVYESIRRKLQMLMKKKPRVAKRLWKKYSRRERNRVKDLLHKLTTVIADELEKRNLGLILEDLNGIKKKVVRKGKNPKKRNRELSKWNCRELQKLLEYKVKERGLPVVYVNPRNSSRICPKCSGHLVAFK